MEKRYTDMALAYNGPQKFLSAEEAGASGFEERLASIWPYLKGQARRFESILKPHERQVTSHEDILSEFVLKLKKEDHKYNPELGTYKEWSSEIVKHEFSKLRDNSRIVKCPNSSARSRQYRELEETVGLTTVTKKTAKDIERTGEPPIAIELVDQIDNCNIDPLELLVAGEERQETVFLVKTIFAMLSPKEAFVMSRLYGLLGQKQKSSWRIANELGKSEQEIIQLKNSAMDKLREILGVAV